MKQSCYGGYWGALWTPSGGLNRLAKQLQSKASYLLLDYLVTVHNIFSKKGHKGVILIKSGF